jgi:hypothetical protein
MSTIETRQVPVLQAQLSATVRFAAAVAVAAALALAWIVAEQASHQAVESASAAISGGATHAGQPAVAVAGRRVVVAGKRS